MRRPLIIGAILAGIAGLWLAVRSGREAIDPPPGLPEGPPAVSPDSVPDDRIAHNGVFAALGRGTYRSRRWLPFVGLALVIGLN
ncbi:MAG: hypothetical protein ACRDG7_06930, partial [Candidatus Limnocylindria bacterium]